VFEQHIAIGSYVNLEGMTLDSADKSYFAAWTSHSGLGWTHISINQKVDLALQPLTPLALVLGLIDRSSPFSRKLR
jgi:hypothetical protein